MRTLSAASLLLLLASAVPGEAAAQQFSSGAITFQRFLTNPKLQTIATQSTTGAAGLAAIATGMSAQSSQSSTLIGISASEIANNGAFRAGVLAPGARGAQISQGGGLSSAHQAALDAVARYGGGSFSGQGGATGAARDLGDRTGSASDNPAARPSSAAGNIHFESNSRNEGSGTGGGSRGEGSASSSGGAASDRTSGAGEQASSASGASTPTDVGSAGLGSQLVGRLNAREAASAMGAEPSVSRAELAPGAAAPRTSAPPADEPVTLLVMVGGRGLAADADLGRGTPLSGAAPNVFCTAHAVAVGAGLEPAVTQYFAPRHHCR